MRTHRQIIRDAGGPMYVATILGMSDAPWTVRSWSARSSIPAPYWLELAILGLATLEELAGAAARAPDSTKSPLTGVVIWPDDAAINGRIYPRAA